MKMKSIPDGRMMFRIRTKMLPLKSHMKGSYKEERLTREWCKVEGTEENITHVLECVAYKDLREDLDLGSDEGLIKYFKNVLLARGK